MDETPLPPPAPVRWPWVLGGLVGLAVLNVFWSGYKQTRQELREDVDDFLRMRAWRLRSGNACDSWLKLTPSAKREALAKFFAARADVLPQSRPLSEAVAEADARCEAALGLDR
jgi:hypothetical protein